MRPKAPQGQELALGIVWRSMDIIPNDRALLPLVHRINVAHILRSTDVPVHSGDPYVCKKCGAFFNPFCSMSERPSRWKCSVCGVVHDFPRCPSDSLESSYSKARKSVAHENLVFDTVSEKEGHEPPKIVLAIQRSVCEVMRDRLCKSLLRNGLFKYAVVVFDSRFHVFDYRMKRWKVVCDAEEFVVPGNASSIFGTATDARDALCHIPPETVFTYDLRFVTRFMRDLRNAKLVLVAGVLSEPAEEIACACSVVIVSESPLTILALKSWLDKPTTSLIQVNGDTELLSSFFYDALELPFVSNCQIKLLANDRLISVKRKGPFTFELLRSHDNSGALFVDIQYVISFTNIYEQNVTRYVTMRVPLSPLTTFYQSSAFSKPFVNASAAASYVIDELIEQAERGESISKQRVSLIELTSIMPMQNSIWPRFAFAMITSVLFATSDTQFRLGFLYMLRMSSNSTLLLQLMSFDIISRALVPSGPDTTKTQARINRNGIYTTSDTPEFIMEQVCKLLAVETYVLPVYQVTELPWTQQLSDQESKYIEWFRNWELTGEHHLEERRKSLRTQNTRK